jgi:SseB protein N-terminal domain
MATSRVRPSRAGLAWTAEATSPQLSWVLTSAETSGAALRPADAYRWAVRAVPDPGFAADSGQADPAVRQAMARAASGGPSGPALAAVLRSRVLVPVVAILGEVERDDGLIREKSSDMAAVLMTGRDGRTGLLAFTGTDAMRAWDPNARPVPVGLPQAAQAAIAEGAAALVLDVAGPARLVVEGEDLRNAAAGARLVRVGTGYAWVRRRLADEDGRTGPV